MNNKVLSLVKYIIGWPLSVVALFFVVRLLLPKITTIQNDLHEIKIPYLIISILLFVIYYFLRVVIWKRLIDKKGNKLNFKNTAYIWAFSEIKRYIPGNLWSFLSRSSQHIDRGIEKREILHSLLVETELVVLGCLAFSYFFLIFFFWNYPINIAILLITVAAVSIFIIGGKYFKGKFFNLIFPSFDFKENLNLFLLSFLDFAIFGIASYFSAISLFYIDIRSFLDVSSLFTFALLVGYLSIVTPMGLGVREGIVTWGLAGFIGTAAAAVASIYTRITLILSELTFLLIIFLWNRINSPKILKLEAKLWKKRYEILLFIFVLIYILYFTTASFLRYSNFYTGRFDLGNMDQAVWNTLHNRPFQITDPNGTNIISRMSFHADLILVLLAPFYYFWNSPLTLLLIQSIILGLGGIFVYLIAREILKNKALSLAFALSFLLYSPMQWANLYDFHPVTLATTFLLATFYFFIKRKYILFAIFAVLSGLTKEEVWAVVAIFGIFKLWEVLVDYIKAKKVILYKKYISKIIFGLLIIVTSLSLFYYFIWIAIPQARGGGHFALQYYSDFGDSPSGIIKNIILSPNKTLPIIFEKNHLIYIFQLFFPLGFLSFFSPQILIFAIPDLVINLLSNNTQLHEIYYQYSSTITPFIFISAIYSVIRLKKRFKNLSYSGLAILLVILSLYSAYSMGPLPGSRRPNTDMFSKQLQNAGIIEDFLSDIPRRYSVAATNNIGSHLSHRQRIYTIPVGIDQADVVIFLLNDPYAQPSLAAQKEMVYKLRHDDRYIEIYELNDFIAFQKRNLENDFYKH